MAYTAGQTPALTSVNNPTVLQDISAAVTAPAIQMIKSHGPFETAGSATQQNDILGYIGFNGDDETATVPAAAIQSICQANVVAGSTTVTADMEFFTFGAALTQRMVIASTGAVTIVAPDSGVGLTIAGGGEVVIGAVTQTAGNISLGADAAAQTILIGTGAADKDITIGSATAGSTISMLTNTSFALNGAAATTYDIGAATTTGTITIGGTAQTGAINLGTGTGATLPINIGTGAAVINTIQLGGTGANVIRIADTQTAGSLAMGTAMTTGTVSIGGTGAAVGAFSLAPGTGAQAIGIGASTGIKTITVGGSGANVIKIGDTSTLGTIAIGSAGTTSTTIGNATGTLGLHGATTVTGALTQLTGNVSIGADAAGQTLLFGTGAAAKLVTVGSTTAASTLVLNTPVGTQVSAVNGLIAAAGGLTATVGAITATNGNLVLGTSGNGIKIKTGGAADTMGTATLITGTKVVATTAVAANSIIFVTRNTPAGAAGDLAAPTALSVPSASIVAGTSFVINAASATDTSTVNWIIINPA